MFSSFGIALKPEKYLRTQRSNSTPWWQVYTNNLYCANNIFMHVMHLCGITLYLLLQFGVQFLHSYFYFRATEVVLVQCFTHFTLLFGYSWLDSLNFLPLLLPHANGPAVSRPLYGDLRGIYLCWSTGAYIQQFNTRTPTAQPFGFSTFDAQGAAKWLD